MNEGELEYEHNTAVTNTVNNHRNAHKESELVPSSGAGTYGRDGLPQRTD